MLRKSIVYICTELVLNKSFVKSQRIIKIMNFSLMFLSIQLPNFIVPFLITFSQKLSKSAIFMIQLYCMSEEFVV